MGKRTRQREAEKRAEEQALRQLLRTRTDVRPRLLPSARSPNSLHTIAPKSSSIASMPCARRRIGRAALPAARSPELRFLDLVEVRVREISGRPPSGAGVDPEEPAAATRHNIRTGMRCLRARPDRSMRCGTSTRGAGQVAASRRRPSSTPSRSGRRTTSSARATRNCLDHAGVLVRRGDGGQRGRGNRRSGFQEPGSPAIRSPQSTGRMLHAFSPAIRRRCWR